MADQGFSDLREGCLLCPVNTTGQHPQLIQMNNGNGLFWVCPNCNQYYGAVEKKDD